MSHAAGGSPEEETRASSTTGAERLDHVAGSSADPMIGMEVLGCRLLAPVGTGASGTVFRARQLRLERDVAVKLVPVRAADVDTTERFRREVRSIAALDHPHVVPVHDAGEEDGLLVLVMKLVDGVDLRALVAERGPVEPAAAVAVLEQVASALDAAHAAGLVHRDVKPANILLSRAEDRRAYLADFGLARARATEATVTAEGSWVGTPAYAAPEQRAGGEVGPAADRYALAGVLSFLVTGAAPGAGVAPPEGTRALVAVSERGMASAPQDRFATCRELADAARAALGADDDTVVLAQPVAGADDVTGGRDDGTLVVGDPVAAATDGSSPSRRPSPLLAGLLLVLLLVVLAGVAVLVLRQLDGGGGTAAPPAGSASSTPDTASSVSPTPSADPTPEVEGFPALGPGSSGVAVRTAQLLLVADGQDVVVTGTYDDATAEAVRGSLAASGAGGASGRLDDAAWRDLVTVQALGRRGDAATAVQELLVATGATLEVDGSYGSATEQAVIDFQQSDDLVVDGVVGARTWQALLEAAG